MSSEDFNKKKKEKGFKFSASLFFYFLGALVLAALIYNLGFETITATLKEVGFSVFWVFASAILWVLVNSYAVSFLVNHQVPFKTLLYVDLTGNAYNNIIPLAGVGGEPYKIKILSEHIGLDRASRAMIQNRLINSTTSFFYTVFLVAVSLLYIDLEKNVYTLLLIAGCLSAVIGTVVSWLTLSSAPDRVSKFILQKSNLLKEYKAEPLSTRAFLWASFWQLIGRALNMVEIYLIFWVLGFDPYFSEVVFVSCFLSISSAIFFMIPQNIGASEAGVSTAFVLLGYSATLGLTYGLIRRARVIFWALFGVSLHLGSVLWEKRKN